jgi:hypothetical protein
MKALRIQVRSIKEVKGDWRLTMQHESNGDSKFAKVDGSRN